jgi:hypothetical protein
MIRTNRERRNVCEMVAVISLSQTASSRRSARGKKPSHRYIILLRRWCEIEIGRIRHVKIRGTNFNLQKMMMIIYETMRVFV